MSNFRQPHIDVGTLRRLLLLDQETGKLYWRKRGVEWFTRGACGPAQECARWNARHSGGYFTEEKDAAIAYNAFARTYHGEFARLNCLECDR